MHVITVLLLTWLIGASPAIATEKYLIFAAASMKDALEEIATSYRVDTGNTLVLSLAGTSKLARQIDHGAPADIVISADEQWMDWLAERSLIKPDSRISIAGNRLVIAVRREVENWAGPIKMLTDGLAAIADTDAIPAGRYAKQALSGMGKWQQVSKRAVSTENVRLALALLVRGEVEAAIVYASDVNAEPQVRAAYYFAPQTHSKIAYPAALTSIAANGATEALAFLSEPKAQAIFAKHGFQPAAN